MRKLSLFLALLLLVTIVPIPASAADATFQDIADSPYKAAIENLQKLGIVSGTSQATFEPNRALTRAEAAMLIKKVFRLVDIVPQDLEDQPDLPKTRVYSGSLGVVNESFTVSASKDSVGHWAHYAIESVVNSDIMALTDQKFSPQAPISGDDFATALAKAIYGPEQPVEHLNKAVAEGYIPEDILGDEPLSRAEAAGALDGVLTGKSMKVIAVFVTSDIHGHLIPYTPSGSNVPVGSLARMASIVNAYREAYPGTSLLVDGGDSPYNQNIANLFEGRSTIDMMNAMKYDATVLGNHDFDMSLSNLQGLAERAEYPFLSANTYMKDGSFPGWLKESVVKEVDGVKIGIIGLTDDQSKETTHYTNTVDIEFKDDIATGKDLIPKLAAETDIVICLSHLHGKNKQLPLEAEGIDISVGGGQDLLGQPQYIGGTWLINPGKHAECINQVNLNIVDGRLVGVVQNQILLSQNLPEDPAVKAVIAAYEAQMDEQMKQVVGSTSVDLDGERSTVRFKESNLGNLIADALRDKAEADIAFQNGGGIRASILKGDITLEDVYAALPFDNAVTVIEITGKDVRAALENAVSTAGTGDGRYLQVSGIKYAYDISKPAGERIVSVLMEDDTELDPEKTYKVVANDFMCGGGDGYGMLNVLNEGDEAVPLNPDAKLVSKLKLYLREVFHEYLLENSPVSPALEGRITEVGQTK